ncbi:response regulator transcription factor [bacterium]|nr:response regulator transcription factor [bacterium]
MAELTKVLLVDDNPKYLEDILPFYGYEVCVAENGVEALEILEKSTNFDIILLDVMMPKMNGWDTLKTIRKTPSLKDIPVIMVTAVSDDKKMVYGLKMGADDYITKPFILPNLLARIEAVLRRCARVGNKKSSSNVTISQAKMFNSLTDREKSVLLLVTEGKSNKQIADELVISLVTVKSYLYSIFKKLKVKNRTQATLVASQMDLSEKQLL